MKVVYESVAEVLDRVIEDAHTLGRGISRIELTADEFRQLVRDYVIESSDRRDCYVSGWCSYRGVHITRV